MTNLRCLVLSVTIIVNCHLENDAVGGGGGGGGGGAVQSTVCVTRDPVAYPTRGSGCLSTPLAPIPHYQTYFYIFLNSKRSSKPSFRPVLLSY